MEVILFDHVKVLGRQGDLVKVSDGYFRNYLKPNKLAEEATPAALKRYETMKKKAVELAAQNSRDIGQADADQLRGLGLRYFPGADDLLQARHKLSLEQMRLRIGDPHVREDVASAIGPRFARYCVTHSAALMDRRRPRRQHRLSRAKVYPDRAAPAGEDAGGP